MAKSTSHDKIKRLTQLALLCALVVILQLFFASIKVGVVTLSFTLVPIVIAGIFLGPSAGLIVGLVSGVLTLFQVFSSADPFYVFLVTTNPVATALICIIKTSCAGFLSGLMYRVFMRIPRSNQTAASLVAASVCPIVNTGIFCAGMFMFFTAALKADPTFGALAADIVYFVFIVLAGVNFVAEFILNIVVCPILTKALDSTKLFK